ncbi:hypothetical protein [Plesiocystis pacifica]|uniref:hypothetical protein n=1 Tax=Plesiocystis pacifica TaxID=191768 RepID=UPI0012F8EEE8|nr:hypothetical protein [Plesiocystis pacifica]
MTSESDDLESISKTILFISSQPKTFPYLRTDTEARMIQDAINKKNPNQHIDVRLLLAARPSDIVYALARTQPTIVHLSTHSAKDGIVVEGDAESAVIIRESPLADMLAAIPSLRLIILNTDHSEHLARELASKLDIYAIGYSDRLLDTHATVFASAFYRNLCSGASIEKSLRSANLEFDAETPPYTMFHGPGAEEPTFSSPRSLSDISPVTGKSLPKYILPVTILFAAAFSYFGYAVMSLGGNVGGLSFASFALAVATLALGFLSYLRDEVVGITIARREPATKNPILNIGDRIIVEPIVSEKERVLGNSDPEQSPDSKAGDSQLRALTMIDLHNFKQEIEKGAKEQHEKWAAEITSSASKNIIEDIEKRVRIEDAHRRQTEPLDQTFKISHRRLERAVASLERKNTLNLVMGMIIAFIGLGILAFLIEPPQATVGEVSLQPATYLLSYAPRFSGVVIVEILALFFLKLYRSGLLDIKYYHNELTNLEFKFSGAKAALASSATTNADSPIQHLMATERNFILEKGQSTIELERARMTDEIAKRTIDLAEKIVSPQSPKV